MSGYVSPSDALVEAIRRKGGRASVAQIYEFIAKEKGQKELTKREQNTVRMAILRQKRRGTILRMAAQTYGLPT